MSHMVKHYESKFTFILRWICCFFFGKLYRNLLSSCSLCLCPLTASPASLLAVFQNWDSAHSHLRDPTEKITPTSILSHKPCAPALWQSKAHPVPKDSPATERFCCAKQQEWQYTACTQAYGFCQHTLYQEHQSTLKAPLLTVPTDMENGACAPPEIRQQSLFGTS